MGENDDIVGVESVQCNNYFMSGTTNEQHPSPVQCNSIEAPKKQEVASSEAASSLVRSARPSDVSFGATMCARNVGARALTLHTSKLSNIQARGAPVLLSNDSNEMETLVPRERLFK